MYIQYFYVGFVWADDALARMDYSSSDVIDQFIIRWCKCDGMARTRLFRDARDPIISRCCPGCCDWSIHHPSIHQHFLSDTAVKREMKKDTKYNPYSAMNNNIIAVYILGVSSKPIATSRKRCACIMYYLCSVNTLLENTIIPVVV